MRRALLMTILGLGLAQPVTAVAAGGPVTPIQGGTGVGAPGIPARFIALPVGHDTRVERISQHTGKVELATVIRGSFGIPGAAYDGSTTGLAADGRALVVAEITAAYPAGTTHLLVLEARSLRIERRITLRGFFTVDAISPTGRWLYLLHYRSAATNPFNYEVRAYDVVTGQLLAKPVVDPREPDEKMQGFPLTRTMSADGRWAFTLYGRTSGAPFIHALDTATRSAYCVDLRALANQDISSARIVLASGSNLLVDVGGAPLERVDRRTFAVKPLTGETAVIGVTAPAVVSTPAAPKHAASKPDRPNSSASSDTWTFLLPVLAVLVGIGLIAARRRRPKHDSSLRSAA